LGAWDAQQLRKQNDATHMPATWKNPVSWDLGERSQAAPNIVAQESKSVLELSFLYQQDTRKKLVETRQRNASVRHSHVA